MLHRPDAVTPLGVPLVELVQAPKVVFCAEVGALELPLKANDPLVCWPAIRGRRPSAAADRSFAQRRRSTRSAQSSLTLCARCNEWALPNRVTHLQPMSLIPQSGCLLRALSALFTTATRPRCHSFSSILARIRSSTATLRQLEEPKETRPPLAAHGFVTKNTIQCYF